MPTHHDDLELVIGDEWLIIGKLLDEDGKPLDLTLGVELGWTLVGANGHLPGLEQAATLEPQDGGVVRIVVPDTFTRLLTPGRYLDAIRVWVSDEPATQWTGTIIADADPFYPSVTLMPPALPPPAFDDAPDDGNLYIRRAGAWVAFTPPALLPPPVDELSVDAPQDGKLYARQNGQWVPIPSGFSMRFEYQFDDKLVPPPLNSQLRLDNVDGALATKVWVNNNNADGLDVSNVLALIEQDFIVFLQDKDEPTLFQRYRALGTAVNAGTYCELSVASVESGGALRNNQRCFIMVYGGG